MSRKDIERRQRRWAQDASIRCDARGYVRELDDNLYEPLSAPSLTDLRRGSELDAGRNQPARMRSLCSSAVLVANVFGYWRDRENAALTAALGFRQGSAAIGLEAPLPTGLEGDPPLADVLLSWPSGNVAAVESKFTEWLVRRPRHKGKFKPKYFPPSSEIWAEAGRVCCQRLAFDIQSGRERFNYLNAPQLLKHALGLALGRGVTSLVYLYYDWNGREANVHRSEIARFAAAVGSEVDLRVITYQALFETLRLAGDASPGYCSYLAGRYFP